MTGSHLRLGGNDRESFAPRIDLGGNDRESFPPRKSLSGAGRGGSHSHLVPETLDPRTGSEKSS